MREKFQNIIIGLTIGIIVSNVITLAATGGRDLWAEFNDIKIFIDGSEINPKDASGNVVEPFIVNGTTYLPVRAISEALGKEVTWDGSTSSIKIFSPNTSETNTPIPQPTETTTPKPSSNQVLLNLPQTPFIVNEVDDDGIVENVLEITSIRVEQTYYQYSNKVTAKLHFTGSMKSSTRTDSHYGIFEYEVLDKNGNFVNNGKVYCSDLKPGKQFNEDATVFDLQAGETYSLKIIQPEGMSMDDMQVTLTMPKTPIKVSEYNYSDKLEATYTITEINMTQEYRNGEVTIKLSFSGKCDSVLTSTNTNRKIIWVLKDSSGNVVDSGQAYTPILKSGDSFANVTDTIYDLKPGGNYTLEISTNVK